MRKFTLFLMSLFLTVGAMAQIESGKMYRVKDVNTGKYLNAANYAEHPSGTNGGVTVADKADSDDQIFTFEASGNGYYLKTVNGYYIYCQQWNVDALTSKKSVLTFTDAGNGNYHIKNGSNYFKVENVGGTYYPFCDAPSNLKATWAVEDVAIPEYTITYNYSYNGNVVKSVEKTAIEGSAYPSCDLNLYAVSYENVPSGTVSQNEEVTINVIVDAAAYPFEFAATYAEIGNKWYNLIMHSNWNNGGGANKYRTYVGGNNGETLAWGTQRSLTNPGDDYFWAFVGDPINGFNVVNKGAGEGYILSSNGTANPLLKEAANLPDGYNTTWGIATRKYDVSREGDYILEGAWFCLKHTNGSYMNANAGNGNVAFWTDNDNGSAILAVKPLEINEAADVATYYSDNYIVKPTGAEVYYVNNVEDGYAKFAEVTGDNIPAQNGVVVKFTTNENIVYAPEITSAGATAAIEGNMLKGTTKRTLITKETNKAYYVLGMTDGVGFYNAVNGENEGEFYNGAYKAYLEIEGANETATFYGFDWVGTTGVENVEVEAEAEVIYDLTGRRVEEITASGIYIVNGKKVLVK